MDERMRATRTERYLVEALVELLGEKRLDKVQVRELCHKAQVNRTTFYRHYENMEGFVDGVVGHFIADMDAHFDGANIFDRFFDGDAAATYAACVEFMTSHLPFVRAMTGPNGSSLLRTRICGHWTAMFKDAADRQGSRLAGRVEPDVLATFVVSMMWALLEYTVQASDKFAPSYMAAQFSYLLHDCTLKTLLADGAKD